MRSGVPTLRRLQEARAEHDRIREQMIALQEELDWEVYHLYGLLSEQEAAGLRAKPEEVPALKLGERAFEIAMARTREAVTKPFTSGSLGMGRLQSLRCPRIGRRHIATWYSGGSTPSKSDGILR